MKLSIPMLIAAAVLSACAAPPGTRSDAAAAQPLEELQERERIISEASAAFRAEDFRRIDDMAAAYLKGRDRTSSGLWKVGLVHAGVLDGMAPEGKKTSDHWSRMEAKISRWAKASPGSPVAHLAYARALRSHGWFYRGGGYAGTVPDSAWKPFFEYIDRANEYMQRTKRTASADPYWYEVMVEIATDRNWARENFDRLLGEALDREPYYYPTYFAALRYLLPKWHGDLEQIEAFANRAVERTRAGEGMGMYARIYWYASQAEFSNNLFLDSRAAWPKMRAGFDDIMARYPDTWNLNNYARFACLARDRATAAKLLARMENKPLVEAWQPTGLYDMCRSWAAG